MLIFVYPFKTALFSGASGQGGLYLAHHLLGLGYWLVDIGRDAQMADTSLGEGIGETGRGIPGEVVVRIGPHYIRPAELKTMLGGPAELQTRGSMENPPINLFEVDQGRGAQG